MLERTLVAVERHSFGGEGSVYAARSELVSKMLVDGLEGKIGLIYLDPPFGTGGAFEFKDGFAVRAYSDDMNERDYLEMMKTILTACRRLLCASGSLYVHVDYRMSGRLKLMLDEIFGADNFMNEIIWAYKSGGRSTRHFSRKHDNILFYRKSRSVYFNIGATGTPRGSARKNHMKRRADEDGRIYYSIKTGGREYRYYEDDPVYPSDVWDDIEHLHQRDPERTGFSTQKPLALLKRIIAASSREGDTVLDLFGGSGTTAAAAAQLNRSFISCDCGAASLFATRRRLIDSAREQPLFGTEKPFSIIYPDPAEHQGLQDASQLIDAACAKGGFEITVKGRSEDRCSFIALGEEADGMFTAKSYIVHPKAGDKLFVPSTQVLHIVNGSCEQGFFRLR